MSSEPVAVKEATTYPRGFASSIDWKWPMVPARQLLALNYGRALKADTRRPGEIPVYGTNGQCGWHDTLLAKGPGLILGRKGQGPLGVEWCPTNFWVIDTAYYATPLTHGVDLKYLYHLIKYVGLNHLKDGTSNPTLSRAVFGAQLFPLPSLKEQTAITEALDVLDDRITLLRETNATLEAIAQALFKSWFVDFDPVRAKQQGLAPEGMDEATAALFPDGFEESELGRVPKGWRLAPLSKAFDINPTRKLKKGELAPYLDMASVGTQGHIVSGTIPREMGSGSKFVNGDTLLARITPCLENGKSAFVDCLPEGQTGWGSTEFVVLRPKAPLPAYFGYLLCRHKTFRDFAIQSMSGTSGRQRIQNDVLGRFPVAIPSPEVATVFGQVVSGVQQRIAANHAQAQTLATLRDTLLPRLISGQLRLPDAQAELEGARP